MQINSHINSNILIFHSCDACKLQLTSDFRVTTANSVTTVICVAKDISLRFP